MLPEWPCANFKVHFNNKKRKTSFPLMITDESRDHLETAEVRLKEPIDQK